MKKIYPLLITEKLQECADFYDTYFGFQKVFAEDWYIHLVHETGSELAFMAPNTKNQPAALHTGFNGSGLVYSIEVEDAQKEYDRLRQTDVPIIFDLKTEEWGQKHFILQDPSGTYVDIVEQLAQ